MCMAHDGKMHGLRTPNEDINQRNLKIWADVAVDFRPSSEDDFLTGLP